MMGYYGNMLGFGGGIFMLIFWVLVILFIAWAIKEMADNNNKKPTDSAFEILKQRYAKGEISKEEFEIKKADLKNN